MTKKPSEGKAPVTGRSARARMAARQTTEAGRQVVAKRIKDAIEHRGRVVLGDAAARYSAQSPSLRRLVTSTRRDVDQPDVNGWLAPLAGGERPLGGLDFNEAWDQWDQLRALNQKIEGAWAGVERLLGDEHGEGAREFRTTVDDLKGLVDEWEELMAIDHPLGRIVRTRGAE